MTGGTVRLTLVLAFAPGALAAQAARQSQPATVTQLLGQTEVKIAYNRPLAFYFPAVEADRALLNLHWGETIVQIPITVK